MNKDDAFYSVLILIVCFLTGMAFNAVNKELKQQKAMVAYVAHEYASLNKTCVTACHLKGE